MFKFSFDKSIFGDYNEYYIHYNFFENDVFYRDKCGDKTFFLINFDEFKKTLRRKKLTHFSLSHYKIFRVFKFSDMKGKINDFNRENFFHYNCDFDFDFEILFEI